MATEHPTIIARLLNSSGARDCIVEVRRFNDQRLTIELNGQIVEIDDQAAFDLGQALVGAVTKRMIAAFPTL